MRGVARPVSIASLSVFLIAVSLAFAPVAQEKKGEDHKADTPLAQQMERIDVALDKLKRAVRDPAQKELCLTEITNAQQACLASKLLVPKMTPSLPEAERATFVRDYRKGVAALLIEFTNLEVAVLDGETEKATALHRKLESMEEEGHNKFTNE